MNDVHRFQIYHLLVFSAHVCINETIFLSDNFLFYMASYLNINFLKKKNTKILEFPQFIMIENWKKELSYFHGM